MMRWSGMVLAVVMAVGGVVGFTNPFLDDQPQTLPDRRTMVHLFEWRWTDIAQECEQFLQYHGYGAVQVSPPNEHITRTVKGDLPWWVRYQPVSYQLNSRSGNEGEFKDMVERCNKVGVRIVVDGVINHMTGVNQAFGRDGRGSSGGSTFDAYLDQQAFPGVPYSKNDFHQLDCEAASGQTPQQVHECRLVGLIDLDQSSAYVRGKIADFLNHLIDIGVAGFRLDAAKHVDPTDLKTIIDSLHDLRPEIFGKGARPFVSQEVTEGGPVTFQDYVNSGRVTRFRYGHLLTQAARRQGGDFGAFGQFGPVFGQMGEQNDQFVFLDNHDTQRHGDVMTYREGDIYAKAVSYMLAWPYGYPRVMSSYYFDRNEDGENRGPPNNGEGSGFATKGPSFRSDGTCDPTSGWVCEHRYPEIRRMTAFRHGVSGAAATEIQTGTNRIAFALTGKGFYAFNNDPGQTWSVANLHTTLPAGTYCNIYYEDATGGGQCQGSSLTVGDDGSAQLSLGAGQVMAVYLHSRVGGAPQPTPPPATFQRTVILLKKDTAFGQNVFIRGAARSTGCTGPAAQNPCSVRIDHLTKTYFSFFRYQDWSKGDSYLDWGGAEQGQGTYAGVGPEGTPLAYSTNDAADVAYQPLNNLGPGYWMAELNMDCSKTNQGWFEFKGFVQNGDGWESDRQQSRCTGSGAGNEPPPVKSGNHIAKCGFLNVFEFDQNSCVINSL